MINISICCNKFIAVHPQAGGGLGDFWTAAIFAKNFFEEERIPKRQILLVTDEPTKFELFNDYQFCIISTKNLEERAKEIALLVLAPLTIDYLSFIHLRIPTAAYYELNYEAGGGERNPHIQEWTKFANLGLPTDPLTTAMMGAMGQKPVEKLGILIDRDLEKRQENDSFPPGLKRLLFQKDHKLYAGYAYYSETQEAFVSAVSERVQGKNVVIVLPNCDWQSFKKQESLEVIRYHWKEDRSELEKTSSLEPKVVIVTGSIPNWLLKAIHAVAESETVVTGDGSLQEAIVLGKNFVYEQLPHKYRLGEALKEKYGDITGAGCMSYVWSQNLEHRRAVSAHLVKECDAWPKIRDSINALLASSKNARFPELGLGRDLSAIHFNTVYLVPSGELYPLMIHRESGESELPALKDSLFDARQISPGYWSLVRLPKPGSQKQVSLRQVSCCQRVTNAFRQFSLFKRKGA